MANADDFDLVGVFLAEGWELHTSMEQLLHEIERDPGACTAETINSLFRAAHTIKGSAGMVGLDDLVDFTHHIESLLDQVRDGAQQMTPELVSALLVCGDRIGGLLDAAATHTPIDDMLRERCAQALERLAGASNPVGGSTTTVPPVATGPAGPDAPAASGGDPGLWHISIRFSENAFRDGFDPFSLLAYLDGKGELTACEWQLGQVPRLPALDPESCHLGVECLFRGSNQSEIEDAFEFIREESRVWIFPPGTRSETRLARLAELDEDEQMAVYQAWDQLGLLSDTPDLLEIAGSVAVQVAEIASPDHPPSTQEAASATGGSHAPKSMPALAPVAAPPPAALAVTFPASAPAAAAPLGAGSEAAPATAAPPDQRVLRVPAPRLDALISLVGELGIATGGLELLARGHDPRLQEAVANLQTLVDAIQSGTLQLRMVPIGEAFSRFNRIVRDVSAELGKKINLVIEGADTELDKSMVERLVDPLMHLVRNAVDHAIEPAAQRLAAGKPEAGTVRLRALHDSGSIVIEVSDDGAGLNRERILAKAMAAGIVTEGQQLSDAEVWKLIFLPGFSTAAEVTNLSGRGVGMDVVRKNIEALRGLIQIDSRLGQGCTFQLRLPLTLAIIDGFMVAVNDYRFILPLDTVTECIELPEAFAHEHGCGYLNLRGEVLPFLRLRDTFELGGTPAARQNVVVVGFGTLKAGIVVDELLGEHQAVIKPMGKLFQRLHGVSGSSILGSGEIAMILDVPRLIERAGTARASPQTRAETSRAASG